MDEGADRARQTGAPQRLLRSVAGPDLPAPERVPDVRELPDRRLILRRSPQQQAETRRLLEKARKQGNVRLIEMLERDEHSLTRILDGLDQIETDQAHDESPEFDLRDLAAPDQPEGA